LAGLAGKGELGLTGTRGLSRNRPGGIELGGGRKQSQIPAGMSQGGEGGRTTRPARELAQKKGVGMPIAEQIYQGLYGDQTAQIAITDLMTRRLKAEHE